jgi:DNA-binding NtrC family response regulator
MTVPEGFESEPVDEDPSIQSREVSENDDSDHPMVVRIPIGTPVVEAERLLILKTLEAVSGNKQFTARILGISRRGLYTRLISYRHDSVVDGSLDYPREFAILAK